MTEARPTVADDVAVSGLAFTSIWSGVPLSFDELEQRTGWEPDRVTRAVDQLLGSGRLQLSPSSGIEGAHGVTLRSTPHRIRHSGGSTYTWCAFDVVGIAAALGIDAEVTSTCPTCHRQLSVGIRSGEPEQGSAAIWVSFGDRENVMRDFCATANMFCSPEHLEEWLASTAYPTGEALTLDKVAEHGRRLWADVAEVSR